jgi:hypothetical protein
MNQMKIIRLALPAALILVLPASLVSSTESQLQTDLSGVLTIDFFVDILSQSNLQVTAAGPALVRGPTPSLVNTLHMSFPINGCAINQQTLRGELTRAGGMVIASKGKSVTLSSPLLTFGSDFGSADDQTSTLSVLVSVGSPGEAHHTFSSHRGHQPFRFVPTQSERQLRLRCCWSHTLRQRS